MRAITGGLLLDVWVIPGAARTELRGLHDGALRVRVAAAASGGAANRALLRYVERLVGCRVSLRGGAGARRKQLLIESSDPAAIAELLAIENL